MRHRLSDVTLLVRFRDTRDPRAFATLFDRYAVALWRHARSNTTESDADDLVQATFVSVIESVASFDTERAVKPWLFGILTNHLRMNARRDAQRQLDSTRMRPRAQESASTVDVVSDLDVRDRLGLAISGLPEPYREVVAARYEGQLATDEIASQLGREAGTVRKQISRGLTMLRKSLPVEIAMAALVFLSPRRVLAAARSRFSPASPRALSGLVCACAVVFGLCFIALRAGPFEAGLTLDDVADTSKIEGVESSANAAAVAQRSSAAASVDGETAPVGDKSKAIHVTYRDGVAAAGFRMRLLPGRAATMAELQLAEAARELFTDTQGRVQFEGIAAGDYLMAPPGGLPRLYVRVDGDGAVNRSAFRIGSQRLVRGRVVDHRGRPVGGADVLVSATQGRGDAGDVIAKTDLDGVFTVVVGCEMPWLWASVESSCPSKPIRLADAGVQDLSIRLAAPGHELAGQVHRAPSKEGRERESDGVIVAWFPTAHQRRDVAPTYLRCDEDGFFDFGKIRRGPGLLLAQSTGFAPSWRRLARGEHPSFVELRLDEGESLRGIVRDPLGIGVANALVQVTPAPIAGDQLDGSLRTKTVRTDAVGNYVVHDLGVGEVAVFALHAQLGFRAKRFVEIPTTTVCDLDCRATGFVTGRVLDVNGEALAGWQIDGIPAQGADPRMRLRWVTKCRTRADGTFTLQLPRRVPYKIAVFAARKSPTDPTRQPWFVRDDVVAGAKLDLRMDESARTHATIRGRLEDLPARAHARIMLENDAWAESSSVPIRRDGAFELAHLAPGTYRIYLLHPKFGRRKLATVPLRAGLSRDLGLVTFVPPGGLEIGAAGDSLVGASVLIRDSREVFVHRRVVGKSGRLKLTSLAEGSYSVLIATANCEPMRRVVQIVSGQTARIDVQGTPATPCEIALDYHPVGMPYFRRGPVHLRVIDREGQRVFEDVVFADDEDFVRTRCGLPAGDYDLEATCLGGRSLVRKISIGSKPLAVEASMH